MKKFEVSMLRRNKQTGQYGYVIVNKGYFNDKNQAKSETAYKLSKKHGYSISEQGKGRNMNIRNAIKHLLKVEKIRC